MAEPAELQPLDRLVRDAEHILRQAEVPSPRTDAELLAPMSWVSPGGSSRSSC